MSDSRFKIDRGIPIPPMRPRGTGFAGIYPWSQMKPSDSFFVPFNGRGKLELQKSLHGLARQFSIKNGLGWTFTCRQTPDGQGVRIWRIS